MSGIDFMSVIERLQAQENKASQELEKIYQENITEINKRSDNLHNIQSKLDATSKETQKLNTAINKTSLMLEDVTHKIRSLHSAKINAKSALSLVNGLIDIKKSVEGIDDALLKEDYESAASCVERVLKLGLFAMQDVEEEEQQQHQHHYYAGSSSSSGNVSINALRERVEKTRSAVKHEFQSCIDHKNTHGIQRYARLFKGLGIADEGAEMFALYLTNGAWKSLYRYVEENLRLLKDISTSSSYDSIITPIFDQLAAVVETEEATCEEFFGRGSFLNVVDSIAAAADTLAGRVLQHFVTHRNIDHMKSSVFNELDEERMNLSFLRSRDNKKLLSKNNNNNNNNNNNTNRNSDHPSLEIPYLDRILDEMAALFNRCELFESFVLRVRKKCLNLVKEEYQITEHHSSFEQQVSSTHNNNSNNDNTDKNNNNNNNSNKAESKQDNHSYLDESNEHQHNNNNQQQQQQKEENSKAKEMDEESLRLNRLNTIDLNQYDFLKFYDFFKNNNNNNNNNHSIPSKQSRRHSSDNNKRSHAQEPLYMIRESLHGELMVAMIHTEELYMLKCLHTAASDVLREHRRHHDQTADGGSSHSILKGMDSLASSSSSSLYYSDLNPYQSNNKNTRDHYYNAPESSTVSNTSVYHNDPYSSSRDSDVSPESLTTPHQQRYLRFVRSLRRRRRKGSSSTPRTPRRIPIKRGSGIPGRDRYYQSRGSYKYDNDDKNENNNNNNMNNYSYHDDNNHNNDDYDDNDDSEYYYTYLIDDPENEYHDPDDDNDEYGGGGGDYYPYSARRRRKRRGRGGLSSETEEMFESFLGTMSGSKSGSRGDGGRGYPSASGTTRRSLSRTSSSTLDTILDEEDEIEEDLITSLVSDMSFVVRKVMQRAVATRRVQIIATTVNNIASVMREYYTKALEDVMSLAFPSPSPSSVLMLEIAGDYCFTHGINDMESSQEFITSIAHDFETAYRNCFSEEKDLKRLKGCYSDLMHTADAFVVLLKKYLSQLMKGFEQLIEMRLMNNFQRFENYRVGQREYVYGSNTASPHHQHPYQSGSGDSGTSHLFLPFVQQVEETMEPIISYFKKTLTTGNFDRLINDVIIFFTQAFESHLFYKEFTQFGALKLERDIRTLSKFFSSFSNVSMRDKFARLRQIASILNVDRPEEVMLYWQPPHPSSTEHDRNRSSSLSTKDHKHSTKNTGRIETSSSLLLQSLNSEEVRQLLLLRIDFDSNAVQTLNLEQQ